MEIIKLTLNPKSDKSDQKIAQHLTSEKTDVYMYSGQIFEYAIDAILNEIGRQKFGSYALFHLATYGGDPDAAYRLARYLRRHYDKFILSVSGYCKSAGTLIALGAHQIVMGHRAEFGPLDVQVFDPDEFMQRSSGLAISQAMENIGHHAFDRFEEVFLNLRQRSSGVITTKTASEIASAITVGLFSPITEKLDPLRVGEMQRSMDIAQKYGERLGADRDLVHTLACRYPSHSFVIDFEEASRLFPAVREHSEIERLIFRGMRSLFLREYKSDLTRFPEEDGLFCHLTLKPEANEDSKPKNGKRSSVSATRSPSIQEPKANGSSRRSRTESVAN